MSDNIKPGKIGIFDSGYGGLTILKGILKELPQYDYLYLGDNARAPYGSRSFDIVFDFTRQAVEELFRRGCHLVVLACNTASAKALRSIQQHVLPVSYPERRVLGVIRPTVEALNTITKTKHVGLLSTPGTARSHSYRMEVDKLCPEVTITEQACPMWVPLVETGEALSPGADYFVKKYIDDILTLDPDIDTLVLGCTHYPILMSKIRKFAPGNVNIIAQDEIVGKSLADYLIRHPEMEKKCSKGSSVEFLTTENAESFDGFAQLFLDCPVSSSRITL